MPTAIFNLCFPAWANYHCVRGSHLFMSPFPDWLWRSGWLGVTGCPHWVSLTTSWWLLTSLWCLWCAHWCASVVPTLLATVKLTRPVPGAGAGPVRPMPVYPGPSTSSVPVGPARRSRQGSDYQFTLVRGSARQHINSDPRPTTQKLTPWDSLPATDTRGGVINSGALK